MDGTRRSLHDRYFEYVHPSLSGGPVSLTTHFAATVLLGNLSNGVYCIIYGLLYPYLGAWVGCIVSWVFSLFPSAVPFGMALYWRNKTAEKERYRAEALPSLAK